MVIVVVGVRGKGLLIMVDFIDQDVCTKSWDVCQAKGLLVTQTHRVLESGFFRR
ncbi:MAG: hypothetical protein R2741_05595 [Methanolobus sp.]